MGGIAKGFVALTDEITGEGERKRKRAERKITEAAQAEQNRLLDKIKKQDEAVEAEKSAAEKLRAAKMMGEKNSSSGRRSTIRASGGFGGLIGSAKRTLLGE